MHIQNGKGLDQPQTTAATDPQHRFPEAKVDVDRASILTEDSDLPAWYRDGCDEEAVYEEENETTSIIIVERALDPFKGQPIDNKALGETSVAKSIESESDDYEEVDYDDEEDDLYVPESPISTSSTLFDLSQANQSAPAQAQKLGGYSNIKPEPTGQQTEHNIYRKRLQKWITTANKSQNQAGPSTRPGAGMCTICGLRPQCIRGGVKYPTCGLTCASKRAQAQAMPAADMCNYCHRRPKAVVNGRVYPQCGNDCRRRAEQFGILDPLDWESAQPIWNKDPRQPLVQPMMRPKIFQSGLFSGVPPKRNNPLDSFFSTPSSKACVVCQRNPPYNDGLRSFPTCGRKCGEIWKSRLPSGGRSRSQSQPPRPDYNYHYQRAPATFKPRYTPKMCSVCHARPQYRRNGTVYPTCGLTCSAKMTGPEALLCSQCRQRPRAVRHRDGKVYPQCGQTCRDKAWLAGWTSDYFPSSKPRKRGV